MDRISTILVGLLTILTTVTTSAQQKEYKRAFTYTYENDIIPNSDRYYSFGNFINYRQQLKKRPLKDNEDTKRYINFTLGQQGYTPTLFGQPDTARYDYTNAG